MSSKLKAITTKAKQLYKTGKFAKWTDAIKEASKQLSKGKKVSGVKKAVKKKAVKKKAVKKVTKKKAVKKSAPKSYHKDTKSHNVKISVVSGIENVPMLQRAIHRKLRLEEALYNAKQTKPKERTYNQKLMVKNLPHLIRGEKELITILKKRIK